MRLFTHHLHLPLTNRAMVPPPSMWRELRERLDRLSHSPAKQARLRVHGDSYSSSVGAAGLRWNRPEPLLQ